MASDNEIKLKRNLISALSILITELPLYTNMTHNMFHVISSQYVACDLEMIAPRPCEHVSLRQWVVQ